VTRFANEQASSNFLETFSEEIRTSLGNCALAFIDRTHPGVGTPVSRETRLVVLSVMVVIGVTVMQSGWSARVCCVLDCPMVYLKVRLVQA
jgi:hypothetical protein